MTLSSTVRLERLSLTNFRCFAQCDVQLHPKLTVLVAENGRGKTAILDAIGIALGLFVDTIAGTSQWHGFERSDVRIVRGADGVMRPHPPVSFTAHGSVDGQRLTWSRALHAANKRARSTTNDAKTLRDAAAGLRKRLEGHATGGRQDPAPLPLVAFYGAGRLWSEHRLTQVKRTADPSTMGRLAGYIDCLSPSSSFKTFADWYEKTANDVKNPTGKACGPNERPEKLLAAVRGATRTMLEPTGWHDIDWDFASKTLVVEDPDHGRLPLFVLSDGVRNMIALVADLAHRCARLNPHFGEDAALLTPGILLIDEVDMHLHPRWQQLVVGLLQKVFPAMQMVVTTHSPQLLSTVDVESIRVVRLQDGEGLLETPSFQTRGVDSADVLAAIMRVDPVPPVEEARRLSRYRAFIEDGKADTAEAAALRTDLLDHFGPRHPVMMDSERLLRFQAFKFRRTATPGQEG